MSQRIALAVRPYGERLRPRVFRLLEELGLDVRTPEGAGSEASNEDVVALLREERADVLLVPFHVVRTPDGGRTTGLDLVALLRQRLPWTGRVPVVMPVSLFAAAAFEKVWSDAPVGDVFPLKEDDLPLDGTRSALMTFLERPARRLA